MYLFDQALEATMKLLSVDSVQGAPCADSPFGEGVAKCLRFVEKITALRLVTATVITSLQRSERGTCSAFSDTSIPCLTKASGTRIPSAK